MNRMHSSLLRSTALASVLSLAIAAHATGTTEDSDAPKISVSGSLDLYYQFDMNKPATRANVNMRQYDVRHNSFTFAAARLKFVKASTDDSPVGGTIDLLFGPNAETNVALDPGGVSLENVAQAYVSYGMPGGVNVDFGKFYTWISYELANAGENDNYSRSFNFTYGEPIYHVGVRATKKVGPIAVMAAIVNGWNESEDSNGPKTLGLSLGYTKDKLSTTLNVLAGTEGAGDDEGSDISGIGFPSGGQRKVTLYNLASSFQATDTLKVGLTANSAEAIGQGEASSGKWRGLGVYGVYKIGATTNFALRYESFSDPDGFRTGLDQQLNSLTASFSCVPSKDVKFLLEFRHDTSNRNTVFDKEGSTTSGKRDTVTFASIFKF